MFCDPDISALHGLVLAALAGAFGWKAATELQMYNKAQAIGFAVFFGLLGPWTMDAAFAEQADLEFQFGGIVPTIGLGAVGVVASWMMDPRAA